VDIELQTEIMPHTPATSPTNQSRSALFGIFNKKERWGLSLRGFLTAAVIITAGFFFVVLEIRPFLAETHRVNADYLVVEGWIHEYAVKSAVKEFNLGHYKLVFATGGPLDGNGGYTTDQYTSASVGAGRLKKFGIPAELVQMVPSRVMDRDRTYGSAVALRNWLGEHNLDLHSINVVTEGAHARRTRLLFQEAFGDDVKVGIISVSSPDYDASHWWHYSEGVREIVGESIAYVYAKFFFHPTELEQRGLIGSTSIRAESLKP